ncbi:MAG: GNAT family N-acetyltransferase [Pseudomonadota bacterium]
MSGRVFDTHWITSANAHLLGCIAAGTFDHAIDPERLTRYLANPCNWMIVAMVEGIVVSMCMCVVHDHPDKPTELFLDEIGTGDDWRQQGAARALIKKVFERADAEGIEEIWLGTEPDNVAVRALYEGTGAKSEEALIYYLEW